MFPDAKWLDALKLPIKVKVAIALACSVLLYLFKGKALTVGTLDPYITAGLIIASVVFGIFAAVDTIAWLAKPLSERRHRSMMATRRAVRRKELEEQREAHRATVLARLDHLSREEIRYIAGALEKNTSTFYTFVHSPPVGIMLGKGLVWSNGGTHHEDHYPFSFHDFVWAELLKRRDEFLAKEQGYRKADAGKQASHRRPW